MSKIDDNNIKKKEKHKETIKKYRENNKEKLRESCKKYYLDNKEKEKERLKKYYEDNKEKLKENKSEKINCSICDSLVSRSNISQHKKSKKCKKIYNDKIVEYFNLIKSF